MKRVVRTKTYREDIDAIEAYIAQDNPKAAIDLWFLIDDQVEKLSDTNFPRRPRRVVDTFELVAHPNYIVIMEEDVTAVTVINVVHARKNIRELEARY